MSATPNLDTSYGIYTIERLPKGSKRAPKWDLHSIAKDKETAESHAKTLFAQPYFSHIEVQEFKTCSITKNRSVQKIRQFSRLPTQKWITFMVIGLFFIGVALLFV